MTNNALIDRLILIRRKLSARTDRDAINEACSVLAAPPPQSQMVVPPIEHIADLIDDAAPGVLRPDTRLRIASRLRSALSAPETEG